MDSLARTGRAPATFAATFPQMTGLRVSAVLLASFAVSAAPVPAVASDVPPVRQALRNNCETAALSMLLAAHGVRVDQLTLQRRLAKSGPADPLIRPEGMLVWGDPDKGFVGRVAGGGSHGGYGVYTAPIKALAAGYGVRLRSLNRHPASAIYARLRAGRAVMVWVGLSAGPYLRWRTAAGKTIVGNFGEHTVVLTALNGDTLTLNDPLSGRRLSWRRRAFEAMWARLGYRALSL